MTWSASVMTGVFGSAVMAVVLASTLPSRSRTSVVVPERVSASTLS
jgi:hypothetical protein